MREVILNDKGRRWNLFRRRPFVFRIPESWTECADKAPLYWKYVATMDPAVAKDRIMRSIFGRKWQQFSAANKAVLLEAITWAEVVPDCSIVPVKEFEHNGTTYVFPDPMGPNVSGVEFALADDYYKSFVAGDETALLRISACIWRKKDWNDQAALVRGDYRVLLHNKVQVEHWCEDLQTAPAEYHIQAFNWFLGLKLHVNRVYGPWIFDEPDEDQEDDNAPVQPDPKPTGGPNFGWWGIFIDIADAGAYGTKNQVYQESIHDICIYLVKKRADANQAPEPKPTIAPEGDNED